MIRLEDQKLNGTSQNITEKKPNFEKTHTQTNDSIV